MVIGRKRTQISLVEQSQLCQCLDGSCLDGAPGSVAILDLDGQGRGFAIVAIDQTDSAQAVSSGLWR